MASRRTVTLRGERMWCFSRARARGRKLAKQPVVQIVVGSKKKTLLRYNAHAWMCTNAYRTRYYHYCYVTIVVSIKLLSRNRRSYTSFVPVYTGYAPLIRMRHARNISKVLRSRCITSPIMMAGGGYFHHSECIKAAHRSSSFISLNFKSSNAISNVFDFAFRFER
jgi:hypothetical protein